MRSQCEELNLKKMCVFFFSLANGKMTSDDYWPGYLFPEW